MSTHIETTSPKPQAAPVATTRGGRGWLVLLALVVVTGVGVAFWWAREHETKGPRAGGSAAHRGDESSASSEGSESSEHGAAHVTRVEVVRPKKGGMQRTSTQTGSVHAFEYSDLYAKVSGYLKEQSVDIGSRVKQGDVLATIEDPEVVTEQERAAASVAQMKAAAQAAEKLVSAEQAKYKAAQELVHQREAEVQSAVATRNYRNERLARYKRLLAQNAVDERIVEEEQFNQESAVASEHVALQAVQTAKANVLSAEADVEKARANLIEAQANIKVAEATLAKAKVFVQYTKIVSPYNGVITLRSYHPGAFIRSAEGGEQRPLLSVATTDKVRVVTYIPDRDVPFVDVGDDAEVRLDALPGVVFKGKISRFADTEDPQSRTMRTEIDLPNPDHKLREGMYGIATVILEKNSSNLTIPVTAVTERKEGNMGTVYVVRDGKAHALPVKLGGDDGIRVEVTSGLKDDDRVIANGGTVTEGSDVAVAETPGASA